MEEAAGLEPRAGETWSDGQIHIQNLVNISLTTNTSL